MKIVMENERQRLKFPILLSSLNDSLFLSFFQENEEHRMSPAAIKGCE